MKVAPIDKRTAELFVKSKHYSRRASVFWAAFGLVEDGLVVGVAVFGMPSPPISRSAFKDRDFKLYELARVVVQTKTPNAASFLVASALKLLDRPSAVVSYADTEYGHSGIIYQATNWLYTGATKSHDHAYLVDGARVHPLTLKDRGISNPKQWARENGVQTVAPLPKHRYFYLNGTRPEKRRMAALLRYPVVAEYPKSPAARYDDGPDIHCLYEDPRLTGSKRSGNKLPVLSTENEMSKFTLTIEVNSLEELAKLTVALKGATVAVTGGGAATPTPATSTVAANAAAIQEARAVAAAPPAPADAALDFKTDVLGAYGAALKTKKAEGVTAINAQFGINGPLAIKDKPELWPAYIASLNA